MGGSGGRVGRGSVRLLSPPPKPPTGSDPGFGFGDRAPSVVTREAVCSCLGDYGLLARISRLRLGRELLPL